MTKNLSDILKLSISERILLVEEIWDSIANENTNIPLTDRQINIIEERLAAYNNKPDAGKPWEEVRNELLKKYGL